MRHIALALVFLSLTSCPGLGTMMRNYGYKDIRPASTLFAPGTIVWVRNRSPFQAGVICTANEALGSDFQPIASGTMNAAIKKYAKKGFSFEAEFLSQVSSDNVLSAISSMQMKLSNPRIYEVHDAEIRKRVKKGAINPWCLDAIAARREEGYRVTMISSALQGDISYVVDWNNTMRLSADAKVAALKNLSIQMGVETSNVSESSFTATGLYLGIIEDRNLARLFAASPTQLASIPKRASMPVIKSIETIDIPDPAASDYSGSPDLPDMTWQPPVAQASGGRPSQARRQPTYDTPQDASSAPIAAAPELEHGGSIPDAFSGNDVPGVFGDVQGAPSGDLTSQSDGGSANPTDETIAPVQGGAADSATSARPGSSIAPAPSQSDRQSVAGIPPAKGQGGQGELGSQAAQPAIDTTGTSGVIDEDDDEDEAGKPTPPVLPSKRISIVPREYIVDTAHHGHGHGRAGIQGAAPGEGIRASRLPPIKHEVIAEEGAARPSNPSENGKSARPVSQMPDSTQAGRRYGHGANPYRNTMPPRPGTDTPVSLPPLQRPAAPQTATQQPASAQEPAKLAPQARSRPRMTGPRPVTGVPQAKPVDDERRRSGSHPGHF